MTTSIRTFSVLIGAMVASLLVSQADASNLKFRPMEPSDILDNFELDTNGQTALNGRVASDGTKEINWIADEDFAVVDNGGDGFVKRLSGNPSDLIAYLPYMYQSSRMDVNSVFADVSLPDYQLAGRSDAISIGFVNDQGSSTFSSTVAGAGASDLWLELARVGDTNTANASVFWRVGQQDSLLGRLEGIAFSPDQHIELELGYDPGSGLVAARVGNTNLFNGADLGANPNDVSTWTAQLPPGWAISSTGYGFQMDSGIGGAVYALEAVPEPSSLLMVTLAGLMSGMVLQRRRKA